MLIRSDLLRPGGERRGEEATCQADECSAIHHWIT
jgi:hypothetical protein